MFFVMRRDPCGGSRAVLDAAPCMLHVLFPVTFYLWLPSDDAESQANVLL